MKCVLLFLCLCLLACSGHKYAGVPEGYHVLLDQALVKAGREPDRIGESIAECSPRSKRRDCLFNCLYAGKRLERIEC